MPEFEYRAVGRNGETILGRRSAANREALDAILRREQLNPTRIVEKGKEIAIPKPKVVGKVSAKELAIFTRQFSVMIDAGLPLVQCLEILSSQQENQGFAKALAEVRASVEAGSTLANGLRLFPKIYDSLYCNMVEAGETGGILDTILQRLSGYIEKAVKLKRAVQSA
ncbi:MAG: type II secretion system F family protein, partial [Terriglobia bacterium]